MMSLETTIADEVVTLLNGNSFSQPFTAVRDWMPVFDPDLLSNLSVVVIPKRTNLENASRKAVRHDIEISIAVQQRLGLATGDAGDKAEIDLLQNLADEIRNFLIQRSLTSASFSGIEHRVLVDPAYLYELRTFTSLITLTYRAFVTS